MVRARPDPPRTIPYVKRALVIEHDELGPAEGVGERLIERGYELTVFRVLDDPSSPVGRKPYPDPTAFDVVLVTGSPWSIVRPDEIDSWLGREVQMVQTAHRCGVPVLGLCFGGQILSLAMGGTVSRTDTPEFGWQTIDSDLPDLVSTGPWFEWHYDCFTVPEGAVEVARNAVSPQVFRIGRSVGTQFHPEMTPRLTDTWVGMDGGELVDHGVDPEMMAADSRRHAEGNRARADALVDWFLDG